MVDPLGKGFDFRISLTIFIPSDSALAFWFIIIGEWPTLDVSPSENGFWEFRGGKSNI